MPPFRHKRLPGSPSDLNTGKRIGLRNRLFKLVQTIAPSVPFPVLQSEGEPGISSNFISFGKPEFCLCPIPICHESVLFYQYNYGLTEVWYQRLLIAPTSSPLYTVCSFMGSFSTRNIQDFSPRFMSVAPTISYRGTSDCALSLSLSPSLSPSLPLSLSSGSILCCARKNPSILMPRYKLPFGKNFKAVGWN